ncbi:6-bladed beta-propeller [Aliifodinibius sp. S!AR15-10]|uniref:6-bladed beta-propeller n=1 Tax=Aliifodinibius sp. S!AR15-10 TaxID=2950437 RepID=UPI00285D509B|nr:6-bladed beta-propeller [Aliifodinibius sp. S!AR15-10]MDR8393853.1 6-bladed beta-propeller [Aliifodinibius sp. S!AR15-10]
MEKQGNPIYRIFRDVDDEGRVIIWDIDMDGGGFPPRNRLYVYNPDGTYYTQIGRTGRGPGEFGMLVTMHATAGSVFALDHTNKRMNMYNTNDYSFERSTVVEQWSVRKHEAVRDLGFANLYTRNDGNHIAKFIERVTDTSRPVSKYLLIDTDGNALNFDPLVFTASPSIRPHTTPPGPSVPLPFMGNTIIALSGKNALYSA